MAPIRGAVVSSPVIAMAVGVIATGEMAATVGVKRIVDPVIAVMVPRTSVRGAVVVAMASPAKMVRG